MRSLVRPQLKTCIKHSSFSNDLRLYTSYILFNNFYKYLTFKFEKSANFAIFLKNNKSYYFLLHCRLSTNFFTYQLSDMFAYELSLRHAVDSLVFNPFEAAPKSSFIIVYNLHNLLLNNRVFIFVKILSQSSRYSNINTITELFANSN